MTGQARKLVDMMQRRKVNILCVQKTKKGRKARSLVLSCYGSKEKWRSYLEGEAYQECCGNEKSVR